MKSYLVISEFWHNGLQYLSGDVLNLSDAQAKYIGHAVSEVVVSKPAKTEKVADAAVVAPSKARTASKVDSGAVTIEVDHGSAG